MHIPAQTVTQPSWPWPANYGASKMETNTDSGLNNNPFAGLEAGAPPMDAVVTPPPPARKKPGRKPGSGKAGPRSPDGVFVKPVGITKLWEKYKDEYDTGNTSKAYHAGAMDMLMLLMDKTTSPPDGWRELMMACQHGMMAKDQ